jgi:hypothetical protein
MDYKYDKVADVNPDNHKTVIKYCLFEDEDGKTHFLTEMVKTPDDFVNKISKGGVAFGAIGVCVSEQVPLMLAEVFKHEEEANAKLLKTKGKPKLTVVKND